MTDIGLIKASQKGGGVGGGECFNPSYISNQ